MTGLYAEVNEEQWHCEMSCDWMLGLETSQSVQMSRPAGIGYNPRRGVSILCFQAMITNSRHPHLTQFQDHREWRLICEDI